MTRMDFSDNNKEAPETLPEPFYQSTMTSRPWHLPYVVSRRVLIGRYRDILSALSAVTPFFVVKAWSQQVPLFRPVGVIPILDFHPQSARRSMEHDLAMFTHFIFPCFYRFSCNTEDNRQQPYRAHSLHHRLLQVENRSDPLITRFRQINR